MGRIIINIAEGISVEEAINLVNSVVDMGRISKANGKNHYCWHSCFKNGCVSVKVKYATNSDTFYVHKCHSSLRK